MRINTNIGAINNLRISKSLQKDQSKSIEGLSSGLRIRRASDDAAGLAISEKMRGQIRGLHAASRNAQDAISLIQTAEGAASSVHNMLQRARELSVQSINGTYTDSDRAQIQAEVEQIVYQINTVATTTEFNTLKLLDATGSSQFASVSQDVLNTLTAKLPGYLNDGLVALRDQFGIALPDSPTQRLMEIEYYEDSVPTAAAASMGTSDGGATLLLRVNLEKVIDGTGNIISEGALDTLLAHEMMHALQFTEMNFALTDPAAQVTWFLEGLAQVVQGNPGLDDGNVAEVSPFDGDYGDAFYAMKTLHEITVGGLGAIIDRLEAGDTLNQAFANTTQDGGGELAGMAGGFPDGSGFDTSGAFVAWFNANSGAGALNTYLSTSSDFDGAFTNVITNAFSQGSTSSLSQDATITNGTGVSEVNTHYSLSFRNAGQLAPEFSFQIGANSGQIMQMNKMNLTSSGLGIQGMDVSTVTDAQSALGAIDSAINIVSKYRSEYGALQNRLEHTISNLDNAAENLTSSESRIRDLDMASEMMNMTKSNILISTAQSILAQANSQPQGVLQLLR